MSEWLNGWLIDWLTDGLINWIIDWWIGWLVSWAVGQLMVDWLTDLILVTILTIKSIIRTKLHYMYLSMNYFLYCCLQKHNCSLGKGRRSREICCTDTQIQVESVWNRTKVSSWESAWLPASTESADDCLSEILWP